MSNENTPVDVYIDEAVDDLSAIKEVKESETENQATVETAETENGNTKVENSETNADVEIEVSKRKQQVTVEFDVFSDKKKDQPAVLILPSTFKDDLNSIISKLPNMSIVGNVDERIWANVVQQGSENATMDGIFEATLEEPTACFKQYVDQNGIKLIASTPKFKPNQNEKLIGERAQLRMMSHFGLGDVFQVPLWHSGFWITFKPPTESELIELNRRLAAEKVKIARVTYGLAFSNILSYALNTMTEFALAHVLTTTVKSTDINLQNIREHISSQDIPSLLWGFACTMYPRGFNYQRACVTDPTKCHHIVEELLNVSKLQWVNNNALTDWQKTHMSSRQAYVKDLESIVRYKEELHRTQKRRVSIAEAEKELFITLRTPSLIEHINSGHKWIGNIVEYVNGALGNEASTTERDNFIISHSKATAMRQYGHWVDSIEFGENLIDDLDTIEETLSNLSGDDSVRDDFISAVRKYIDESTISVIGVPTYVCPACKTEQKATDLEEFKNIIPLDVVQVFFELMSYRVSRTLDR